MTLFSNVAENLVYCNNIEEMLESVWSVKLNSLSKRLKTNKNKNYKNINIDKYYDLKINNTSKT